MALAILLIAVGIVFLLTNLGVVDWDAWETLWRLWPLLLIAIGLDLMLGRRRSGFLVAGVLLVTLAVPLVWWQHRCPAPARTEVVSQPLQGAKQVRVTLEAGVARLKLGSHPQPQILAEGTVRLARGQRLEQELEHQGEQAIWHLKQKTRSWGFFRPFRAESGWDIRLNRTVPIELAVRTGVGETELDLRELAVTDLRVDTGVGQTRVILPEKGRLQAVVEGGVGDTLVRIPTGVASRVEVVSGIGSVEVEGLYRKEGQTYLSPDYDTAPNRVDLRLEGGVGRISVERLAEPRPPVVREEAEGESQSPP